MTTQEKQQPPCEAEHTPFKMICKSNGTSQYYECMHCGYIDFSEAIDSAKREGAIEIRNLYGSPKCEALHHPKKYQHTALEDCPVEKEINALTEQSEESE